MRTHVIICACHTIVLGLLSPHLCEPTPGGWHCRAPGPKHTQYPFIITWNQIMGMGDNVERVASNETHRLNLELSVTVMKLASPNKHG